ncbi:hypothetical protein [Rhodanobacter sp. C03]|uniref:hypothetical protein n=1 Tax=Rhodanobacter sp. C03 TaxID=1945858 RepID=UPI000985168D|nr:hypothetical protein [Rhodanobacter sp. C03]OOG59922.1 hypothetical protein B0E48_03850 [Rhodanobacter sp. C03]
MNSLSKQIIVVAVTCGLSACASIIGGRYQPVSIDARAGDQSIVGADCTLTNDRGQVHVTTPGTVIVHRASAPLSISCEKGGTKVAEQSVPSHVRGMVWGNIVFGGLIGVIVDFSDGAAHHYPQMVTVMSQMVSTAGQADTGATTMGAPAAGQSGGLASLDPRIGKPMFNAAQNVAAREQCDSAIRVLMADGQRALFEASCAAAAPIKIECQQDRCTSMHADSGNTTM